MDPNAVSLNAILAAVSNDSMIFTTTSTPNSLAFGIGVQQTTVDLCNTHNHPKTPLEFLNATQLTALTANLKADNQQFAISPPNSFIAASPLSSISSISSVVDTSPTSLNSLSALSTTNLHNLTKLISSGPNISQMSSSVSFESTEILNRIRGVLTQICSSSNGPTSNVQSPFYNTAIISAVNNDCSPTSQTSTTSAAHNQQHLELSDKASSNGPRRIRRRRPKSLKAQPAKKANKVEVEVKEEEEPSVNSNENVMMSDSSVMEMTDIDFNVASETPEPITEEESHRQKSCRVCGDHATGYNFNVISCESCKAFFRRNALRPKDFKCPYTGDCEINAISRRFCQKCRLAKCFRVGMKKEWILNDEQLKRRKNSRLNSLKSVGSVASIEPHSPLQQYPSLRADSIQVSQHTLPPLPNLMPLPQDIDENIVKRGGPTQHLLHSQISMAQPQLIKQTFMTSPQLNESRTSREDSTNRSNATIHQFVDDQQSLNSSSPQHKTNLISPVPSQYSQIPSMNPKTPLNILVMPFPGTSPTIELTTGSDVQGQKTVQQLVDVPVEEYIQSLQNKPVRLSSPNYQPNASFEMPVSTPTLASTPLTQTTPAPMSLTIFTEPCVPKTSENKILSSGTSPPQSSLASSPGSNFAFPFLEWSPTTYRQMEESVQEEFESCSPGDLVQIPVTNQVELNDIRYEDNNASYKLNSSELMELDIIRNVYVCMDEPLNDVRDVETLNKKEPKPRDVINIIDIVMRRFVKMTKKLPAFNTLSQHAKLSLLKASMVKMITMRGVTKFDPNKLCWNTSIAGRQNISFSCNIFDDLNASCQKSKFIRFCCGIHEVVRKNEIIINLIGLLILFSNNIDTIKNDIDKMLIEKYHSMYGSLLRRYIESIHGNQAAPIIATIPLILEELNNISKAAENIFVGKVEPTETTKRLPMEFFKIRPEETSKAASSMSLVNHQPNQQSTSSA